MANGDQMGYNLILGKISEMQEGDNNLLVM